MRIGLEEREDLHPGRQPGEKPVEREERFLGFRRLPQPGEDVGAEPVEDLDRALRPKRRIGRPAGGDLVAEAVLLLGFVAPAPFAGEEVLHQLVHALKPVLKFALELLPVAAHQAGEPLHLVVGRGQIVGLRVAHHLHAMLHFAVGAIGGGQTLCDIHRHPVLLGEDARAPRTVPRTRRSGSRPPAMIWRVWVKNSISRMPPRPSFMSCPGRVIGPPEPLVRADPQAHVVRVLDRGEVEMPPPDEGRQGLQEPRAGLDVARCRAAP